MLSWLLSLQCDGVWIITSIETSQCCTKAINIGCVKNYNNITDTLDCCGCLKCITIFITSILLKPFLGNRSSVLLLNCHSDSTRLSTSPVTPAILMSDFWNPVGTQNCNQFNSLWPVYGIWHMRSWSTLAQVMVCCLMATSHYLYQCWLLITEILWHSPQCNFEASTQATISV